MNRLFLALLFATGLLLAYGLMTFPVLGHSQACLCDICMDAAFEGIEQAEGE